MEPGTGAGRVQYDGTEIAVALSIANTKHASAVSMFCIVVQQPPAGSLHALNLQCGLSLDPGMYLSTDTRKVSYALLSNIESAVLSVEQTRVPMHSRAEQSAQRCATACTAACE